MQKARTSNAPPSPLPFTASLMQDCDILFPASGKRARTWRTGAFTANEDDLLWIAVAAARTDRNTTRWAEVQDVFRTHGSMRTVPMLRNRFRRMTIGPKPPRRGKALQTCRVCGLQRAGHTCRGVWVGGSRPPEGGAERNVTPTATATATTVEQSPPLSPAPEDVALPPPPACPPKPPPSVDPDLDPTLFFGPKCPMLEILLEEL